MKKIKSLAVIATCTAALLLLAGCDITQEMTVNKDLDGKVKITMEQPLSKTQMAEEFISYDPQKIVLLPDTEDMEYMVEDEGDLGAYTMTLNLPFPIVDTNADPNSEKENSVDVNMMQETPKRIYVVFDESIVSLEDLAFKNGEYNVINNKYYNKYFTLRAKSQNVITSLKVNGKEWGANSFRPETNGKYTVKAKLLSGQEKVVTYVIDTYKPKTNIVNNKTYKGSVKITFSDRWGIKKATLNGKPISSEKRVSKAGTHTLKIWDKAGNLTTRKFKVVK